MDMTPEERSLMEEIADSVSTLADGRIGLNWSKIKAALREYGELKQSPGGSKRT